MGADVRVLVSGSRLMPAWFENQVGNRLGSMWGQWLIPGERLVVVHGKCPKGPDAWASAWVRKMQLTGIASIVEEPHPAEWRKYPGRAGFLRNTEMCQTRIDLALVYAALCEKDECSGWFVPHVTHGTGHCLKEIVRFEIPYELLVVNGAKRVYTGEISDIRR